MKHSGTCHCGSVTFSTDLDPMFVAQCNCSACRKITGSVRLVCMYAAEEVELTGDTAVYTYAGGSGMDINSHRCKSCGSIVYSLYEAIDNIMGVSLGAFDDAKELTPKLEIWTSEKLPWLRDDGCIIDRVEDSGVQERIGKLIESLENR